MRPAPLALAIAGLTAGASAQSFNLDVGDPALGQPSSGYAGAAGQAGQWTALDGDNGGTQLTDIGGNVTNLECIITPGAGSAGNWTADNPLTMGDDGLLMDDLHDVGPEAFGAVGDFSFFGIENGTYDVYTYSWAPDFPNYTTEIDVIGSVDPPQIVGGTDWPGMHTLGVTYTKHRVQVASGTLRVVATTAGTLEYGSINGFQFVPVDSLGTNYCTSSTNSTGAPALISASGSASVATNDLELSAGPVPNQPGIFFYGPNQIQLPFGNGFRCVGGQVIRLPVATPTSGTLVQPVDNTMLPPAGQLTVGSVWNFQAWFRDPAGGGANFNLSNGLELTFVP